MGIGKSKQNTLTNLELQDFAEMTNLSFEEVQQLYKLFRNISTFIKDDGVIDPLEFQIALMNKSEKSNYIIFNNLDLNKDSVINFREFVLGLSTFLNSNLSYQAKFLFQLIDSIESAPSYEITEEKLSRTIIVFLESFSEINISESQIYSMVSKEFDHIFGSSSTLFTTISEFPHHQQKQCISEQQDFQQLSEQIKIEENELENISINNNQEKVWLDENPQESPVNKIRPHRNQVSPNKLIIKKTRTINFQMFHQLLLQNEYILQWLNIDKNYLKEAVQNLQKL